MTIPPGAATAILDSLPDSLDIYFVPRLVVAGDGTSFNTRGEVFRTLLAGGCFHNGKFETTSDIIYWFEMQKDLSTGNIIPNDMKLKQKQALDSAETQSYLNNGRQIFPNHQRVEIYTQTEPQWIIAQHRNWDQMAIFQNESEAQNASNYTQPIPGGFGGYYRWKNAVANYRYDQSINQSSSPRSWYTQQTVCHPYLKIRWVYAQRGGVMKLIRK